MFIFDLIKSIAMFLGVFFCFQAGAMLAHRAGGPEGIQIFVGIIFGTAGMLCIGAIMGSISDPTDPDERD